MSHRVDSVLFVTGKTGAPGRYGSLLALARGLSDRGTRAGVVHARLDSLPAFAEAGIPMRNWRAITRGLPAWMSRRRLRLWVAECGAKLVHVYGRQSAAAGWHLTRAAGIPCVASVASSAGGLRELRLLGRCADRIVAPSESVRQNLVNRARLPKEKIVLVPYGIDVGDYPASFPRSGAGLPVVGTIASLRAGEGVAHFLNAARQLLAQGHRAIFAIVGEGPEARRFRAAAREYGVLEHVTFASRVSDHRPVLASMNIVVHPATTSGTEFGLLEAMAMGKAVVASDVGGVYSIVRDQENGRLVPKGDSDALAEALAGLLSDMAAARRLGQKAREVVRQQFSLDAAVERHLAIYDEITEPP